MRGPKRREFLQSSAAVAATLGVPAFAADSRSANDRIRVAIVGLRGRGRSLIAAFHELKKDNVEIVTFCDCDENVLAERTSGYEKLSGKKLETCGDMREVLDDDSIDVVGFATPNHWHALGTVLACQVGKDVYVEKPGSHTVFEGRQVIEAAAKYNRIVQHGTQNRSSSNIMGMSSKSNTKVTEYVRKPMAVVTGK